MTTEAEITLHFEGGPLDGSRVQQRIPDRWQVVRYEHLPRTDATTVHLYTGQRQRESSEVCLQYCGARRTEASK